MSKFEELWTEITKRPGVITVQNKEELGHVFNLLTGCRSYLEVGTAEGNSLFVLAQALQKDPIVRYIDYGEKHTTPARNEIIARLKDSGISVYGLHGNSHDPKLIESIAPITYNGLEKFDAVLIDAGHTYEDVIADASAYGWMASKYIIFHDVMLPEVNRAFEWYAKQVQKRCYRFVNSETFGYGIIVL